MRPLNPSARPFVVAGAAAAALLFATLRAQQPVATPAPGSPTPGLNDACGGRSQKPTEPCPNDVTRMMATLGLLPDKPPAAPQKPRKVLIFSRIPMYEGWQHSSIPLAARLIEELGKKTGAWTSVTTWDVNDINAENLRQYDAIFLSSTTGLFLDDPNDAALTAARRAAFLDFIRGGKGIAGIHATSDSYHGSPNRGAGPAPAASAAPPAGRQTARPGGPAAAPAPAPGRGPMPCSTANPTPGGGGGDPLWPEWNKIIGGYFKFHWNYPTPITVKVDDPINPINAAFEGKLFNTIDEVYTFNDKSFSRDNVHVLLSIEYSLMNDCDKGVESYPRPDRDYALAWIRPEGLGRLFYNALGHHESIYYNNPAMLAHILAGMQYALGDLKVDDRRK